jgi:hypothetical protein
MVIAVTRLPALAVAVQAQSPVMPARRVVGGKLELRHDQLALDRAPQWSLEAGPVMVAGGIDDPDHDLTGATSFELMPDGSLVTLASVGSRLFWFPTRGQGARSLGRQGKGPGELMAPYGMGRVGDTVVLYDGSNNRVNWVVPKKGFVVMVAWPSPSIRPLAFAGSLRGGQLVFRGRSVPFKPTDSISRSAAQILVAQPRAASAIVAAAVPDHEVARIETRYRGRRGVESRAIRFTSSAQVIAWDTVIATNGSSGYRIELRGLTGAPVSTIVVERPRRVATQAMRDSVLAADMRRLSAPGSERMVDPEESRRIARVTPSADSLPSHGQFFVTPGRTLWVVDYQAPGDTVGMATAFRQDGAIIARLTWKGAGSAVAFGDDRVVMRELDDDGVVSLKVYRIRK